MAYPISGNVISGQPARAAEYNALRQDALAAGRAWADLPALTYVSASSFLMEGDYTSVLIPNTRVKLNQATTKYFYVLSSSYSAPNTTVTVVGGSDYTLAEAPIGLPYFCYGDPSDWPQWFNWTPTQVGFSSAPAGGVYRFRVDGNVCTLAIRQPNAGTSNANNFTISLPITAKTITDMAWSAMGFGTDNGSLLTAMAFIVSAGTTLALYKNLSATGWTTSGNKYINSITIQYEI